jgi:hypothetical protein
MKVWKWFCFILACFDTVGYIISQAEKIDNVAKLLGLMTGIVARVSLLYGAATCWVLA